jgi:hypothetical protein
VLGSGFVIAGGCPGWPRSGELLLRHQPFQFVGNISFSWYLTHWPMLIVLPMALEHGLTTADKWIVFVGSLALAVAMYYVVEQPIRSRRLLTRRPSIGLTLGGILIAASVVLSLAVVNISRIPTGTGGTALPASNIETALAQAAELTKLPATTPSLAQASKDRPNTGKCLLANDFDRLLPDSQCTFGDPNSTKIIALVGDSHADQWEPPVSAFGRAHGFKVIMYAKAACPPGVYRSYIDPQTNRIYTQCNDFRDQVFAHLRIIKPQFVIVTSQLRPLDIDPSGMVASVRNFQAAGARVIYLEDTPSAQKTGLIPDCLAKHASDIQKCSLARSAPTTRLEGFIQRKAEVAAVTEAGGIAVDPANWFCTSTTCPPVINNMIVYSDSSHVTATYSAWLTPLLTEALKKSISG